MIIANSPQRGYESSRHHQYPLDDFSQYTPSISCAAPRVSRNCRIVAGHGPHRDPSFETNVQLDLGSV
jgi:hypothetical protein